MKQEVFEGKNNNTQREKLNKFIKVRNSILHKGGIKKNSDQIDMVKRTGEPNNKPPERYKISKNDIEDLRELIIYFADRIELFFWEKMKGVGHDEL